VPQHQAVRALFAHLLAALPSGPGLPPFHAVGAPPPPCTAGARAAKDPSAAPPVPPHISLSRTVPLRLEQARALLPALEAALKAAAGGGGGGRGSARAGSWALRLRGVRAFANDERTRTFAALGVEQGAEQVRRRGRLAVGACHAPLRPAGRLLCVPPAPPTCLPQTPLPLGRQVCKLIAGVDAAFREHGLPPFYEVGGRLGARGLLGRRI
jgi:hypothetical protein